MILSIFPNLSASFYTDEKLPRNRGSSPSMFRRSFFVRFPFLPGHRMKPAPYQLIIHCRFEKPIRNGGGCLHSASTFSGSHRPSLLQSLHRAGCFCLRGILRPVPVLPRCHLRQRRWISIRRLWQSSGCRCLH